MSYFATLETGSFYYLKEHTFRQGKEVKIDKDTYEYLSGNEAFSVREEKVKKPNTKKTQEVGE